MVCTSGQRINLGLNLKFDAKKQKVLGYTRKSNDSSWEYSDKAIELLSEYKVCRLIRYTFFSKGYLYCETTSIDKISRIHKSLGKKSQKW
jgi:hypothetical protein